MPRDLDRERRAATRRWAKGETQIRGVIEATAGMYGNHQGIVGRSLQEIEGLVRQTHCRAQEPEELMRLCLRRLVKSLGSQFDQTLRLGANL
jgi:hypothetical protein